MKVFIVIVGIMSCLPGLAQYNYGLVPQNLSQYKRSLDESAENKLVDLEQHIPGLQLDIRYATTNNFTGTQIYNLAKAYVRLPVAEALIKVQNDLKQKGLELKIYDAYRPYAATVKFYEVYGDTTFVASPYQGSRHNRGCALDLTIIRSDSKKEIKMPTGYDSFQQEAFPDFLLEDKEAASNRDLLRSVMEQHGFLVYHSEWWHFDFIGWEKFEVMDISFEELAN